MCLSLCALLPACRSTAEGYDQRMDDTFGFIDTWEIALKGGAQDRGWSMLSASARRGFDTED